MRETTLAGGSKPIYIGKGQINRTRTNHFDPAYLPVLTERKPLLALALYRDALSTNNIAYQFLGLSRILNIISNSPYEQKKWINDNLDKIIDSEVLKIVGQIKNGSKSVGEHIYNSGRCAVAHAYSEPIVDPDDSKDIRRMHDELPLIKALAEIFIEHELNVKSQSTVSREHLYELAGFKDAISESIFKEILSKTSRRVKPSEIDITFTIGLRSKPVYCGLSKMTILESNMKNSILSLALSTDDKSVQIWIGLDFANEKLIYDPCNGMKFFDRHTNESLVAIKSFIQFKRDLFLNGCFEVRNAENNEILGYTNAYIPTVEIDTLAIEKIIFHIDDLLIHGR
ncbi:MAG: methylamine utilization protein MauJ [Pseudomonadota bacterium]